MDHSYWQKQTDSKPLFPDIEWSKPEQRSRAGKLGIVGGNKLGFASVAESYTTALETGVGQVRILLPDALKSQVPAVITDVAYTTSTKSGGLSSEGLNDLRALDGWADAILMIGDAGRNSETAILYERYLRDSQTPVTLTRDAIDLVINDANLLVERPQTLIVGSFAQIQKLFRAVYYPKMLTFSMQLTLLVEALHKFTITYPVTLVTLHNDQVIIAHDGRVVTQAWDNPMRIWRGEIATKMACYWLWNLSKPLEAAASSIVVHK